MWYRIGVWTPVLADASIFGSIGAISDTGIRIGTTLLLNEAILKNSLKPAMILIYSYFLLQTCLSVSYFTFIL